MKKKVLLCAAVLLVLLAITSTDSADAKDRAPKLKECLQSDYMYFSKSISQLNSEITTNSTQFKDEYDGRYVVLSGELYVKEISNNKKEIKIEDKSGNVCTIDTSSTDVKSAVGSLALNQQIAVYGKISVRGWKKDSFVLVAKKITDRHAAFADGSYVFATDETHRAYKGTLVDDLANDKTVSFYVPEGWDNQYVKSELIHRERKEDGTKRKKGRTIGYQFFLNAISPQNAEYSEIFYIFYFNYETYLKSVPSNLSDGNKKAIEEVIINNILQVSGKDSKIKIETIKDANGTKLDYCSTIYSSTSGEYRLEFVFRPDQNGITCMLYLYYPDNSAVKHVRDVAFLIETMQ